MAAVKPPKSGQGIPNLLFRTLESPKPSPVHISPGARLTSAPLGTPPPGPPVQGLPRAGGQLLIR